MTTELKLYSEYRNLTPAQRLEIYKSVKAEKGTVKSVTKMECLCFEYYVKTKQI